MIPSNTPNIITGNMSPVANEAIGLSGIIFRIASGTVWLTVTLAEVATPAKFKPTPGFIAMAIKRAIVTATAVVMR